VSEFNSLYTSFSGKKYCLHENAKLVFFFKIYTKTIHTKKKKKFTRIVQVNCTVHANTNLKKQLGAASPILRSKHELIRAQLVIK
jgi:hypothetical protein